MRNIYIWSRLKYASKPQPVDWPTDCEHHTSLLRLIHCVWFNQGSYFHLCTCDSSTSERRSMWSFDLGQKAEPDCISSHFGKRSLSSFKTQKGLAGFQTGGEAVGLIKASFKHYGKIIIAHFLWLCLAWETTWCCGLASSFAVNGENIESIQGPDTYSSGGGVRIGVTDEVLVRAAASRQQF